MPFKKFTIALGMLLCTGLVIAQSPDSSQTQSANAPVAAQSAPARAHAVDPAKQAKRLGHELGLTQDQVSQITPIIADRQQQIASVKSDTTLQQSDRRQKMQSIFADSKTKMEAVMNDQQKQQFEQMLSSRRGHHQQPQQNQ